MMPLWLYTLGERLPVDDEVGKVKIPFVSILTTLALLLAPLCIGVVIRYKLPKVSKIIEKCLRVSYK